MFSNRKSYRNNTAFFSLRYASLSPVPVNLALILLWTSLLHTSGFLCSNTSGSQTKIGMWKLQKMFNLQKGRISVLIDFYVFNNDNFKLWKNKNSQLPYKLTIMKMPIAFLLWFSLRKLLSWNDRQSIYLFKLWNMAFNNVTIFISWGKHFNNECKNGRNVAEKSRT